MVCVNSYVYIASIGWVPDFQVGTMCWLTREVLATSVHAYHLAAAFCPGPPIEPSYTFFCTRAT